jgi:HTH-type transcriptional regulator/antitoxin MqsA
MEKIICAACNAPSAIEVKKTKETKYKQMPIVVRDISLYECQRCGEEFFSATQSHEFFRRIKEECRRNLGLLSPEHIIAIRRRYNLNQDDLEKLLGMGQKVVTRWECGKVLQTKPVDDLLRLIEQLPQTIEKLREFRKREEHTE